MIRCWFCSLSGLLVLLSSAAARDSALIKADEELLRAAEVKVDGPGLLDLIQQRTLKEADRTHLDGLIKQLADDDFNIREKATEDLIRLAGLAIPVLQRATRSTDPEQARRAERCLQAIEQQKTPALISAAVRLLAIRKPKGSVPALLGYLPSSTDATEVDEISKALARLGVRDGKADPLLVQALADKDRLKRLVAGEALVRAGQKANLPGVKRLLLDPDAEVRARVALALVEAKDKEAIPVLIDQLKELPAEYTGTIEETLYFLAGEKSPSAIVGQDRPARQRRHQAWLNWWKENGATLSLDRFDLEKRHLGFTVFALYGPALKGTVKEIDKNGKTRWQIDNLAYPVDAQVLPGERVLIAEYRTRLVSERDLVGKVLWQYHAPGLVVGARRLANGHTLVTTRTCVVEVDRDSREVWRYDGGNFCAACKLSDGGVAVASSLGHLIRLNAVGKETARIALGGTVISIGGSLDAGPDGSVLVPLYNQNKIVELNADGKRLWETTVSFPSSVQHLPGGHVLVSSRINRQVLEIDRAGKTVWQQQADGGQMMKAWRR